MIATVALAAFLGCAVLADDTEAAGETYTIQYEVNGAIYSFTTSSATTEVKAIADIGGTVPEGKTFSGWELYTTDDGVTYTASGILVSVGNTVTLNAEYATRYVAVLDTATYTVIFQTIGDDGETYEEISEETYDHGEAVVVPEDPTREGYVFEGWDPEVAETATAEATYTAVWRAVYTITYIVDGTTIATGTTESEATLNVPADPVKSAHTFQGWADADGNVYDADDITYDGIAADIVLTATFRADTYTVTFVYGENATVYGTVTAEYGATIVAPAVPSGYVGWDFDFTTPITGDVTIKALAAEPAPGMSTGMQILLYILGVIAVIAIFFVAYGIRTGKIKLKRSA